MVATVEPRGQMFDMATGRAPQGAQFADELGRCHDVADPQAVRDSVVAFDRARFGARFAAVVADAGSAAPRPAEAAT
jgi:hypothetical protein